MVVAVGVPSPAPENNNFNFDSNCSSPYITAPSSPQRFGCNNTNFFFSAPTSPTRSPSSLFDDDFPRHSSSSSVPFLWEEKPGVPKSRPEQSNNDAAIGNEDFEFDFSALLDRTPLTADELFDGGKIRPLKPPPRLQTGDGNSSPSSSAVSNSNLSSPRSRICQGKRIVQEAFSPRHQKIRDFDPFAAAMEEARKSEGSQRENEKNRGRERISRANSGRKGSRSLSPLRVSDIMSDSVSENFTETGKGVSSSTSYSKPSTPTSSLLSSISFTKGYRKWRLKDFLLFRSASEGRATDKDPLRKYTILSKKAGEEEDAKNSSFRSSEGSGKRGGSTASRRRGAAVSAHELHYTVNRAAAEEMKKKTYLPYKQGLLGCLGFNPGMHGISRGIGSFGRP